MLARFAHAAGLTVAVLAAIPPDQLRGDARLAYDDFKGTGGQVHAVAPALFSEGDVVVDALLGTGLRGAVREDLAKVISEINSAGARCLRWMSRLAWIAIQACRSGARFEPIARSRSSASRPGFSLVMAPSTRVPSFSTTWRSRRQRPTEFKPGLERIVDAEIQRALPRRPRAALQRQLRSCPHRWER